MTNSYCIVSGKQTLELVAVKTVYHVILERVGAVIHCIETNPTTKTLFGIRYFEILLPSIGKEINLSVHAASLSFCMYNTNLFIHNVINKKYEYQNNT